MRTFRIVFVAVIAAVLLAACGGGSSGKDAHSIGAGSQPTIAANDPAHMAPADSVLFASAKLAPGSANLTNLEAAIDKFGGPGAAGRVLKQFETNLDTHGKSYRQLFGGWFDGTAGVAVNAFPTSTKTQADVVSHLVLIFPTTDPAAAGRALPAILKHDKSYATGKVVGHYLLLGGVRPVAQAATAGTSSLADSAGYRADVAKLPANPTFSVYLRASALQQLIARAAAKPGAGGASLTSLLPHMSADASMLLDLSVSAHAIAVDTTSTGISKQSAGASPGVGDLPSGSWIALATAPLSEQQLRNLAFGAMALSVVNAVRSEATGSASVDTAYDPIMPVLSFNRVFKSIRKYVDTHVNSGVGPIRLSVSGSGLTDLQAGVEVTLDHGQNGAGLLSAIHSLMKQKLPQSQITGSVASGTITAHLDGLIDIRASDKGGHVLVTVGYGSDSAFTNPSAKLSGTALYKRALAALPSGATPTVLINFSGISALTELAQIASQGDSVQKLQSTLGKMSYLTAGSAGGDTRIVLALH